MCKWWCHVLLLCRLIPFIYHFSFRHSFFKSSSLKSFLMRQYGGRKRTRSQCSITPEANTSTFKQKEVEEDSQSNISTVQTILNRHGIGAFRTKATEGDARLEANLGFRKEGPSTQKLRSRSTTRRVSPAS